MVKVLPVRNIDADLLNLWKACLKKCEKDVTCLRLDDKARRSPTQERKGLKRRPSRQRAIGRKFTDAPNSRNQGMTGGFGSPVHACLLVLGLGFLAGWAGSSSERPPPGSASARRVLGQIYLFDVSQHSGTVAPHPLGREAQRL